MGRGLGSCRASVREEQSKYRLPACSSRIRGPSILGVCHAASCYVLERVQQSLTHGAFGVARVYFWFIFFGLFVYSFILVFNACSARGHLCKLLILIYQTLYYCTVALGYADIVPTRSKSMELLIPGIFITPQRCNVQVPAARMCLRYTCTAQRPSL